MKSSKKERQSKYQPLRRRIFSEAFKREQVRLIEDGQVTILQIRLAYKVSETAVRNWIKKYSHLITPEECQVVELKSEAAVKLALQQRVSELERFVGQKQLQIDYLEALIEVTNEEMGIDLKKNFDGKHSNASTARHGKAEK